MHIVFILFVLLVLYAQGRHSISTVYKLITGKEKLPEGYVTRQLRNAAIGLSIPLALYIILKIAGVKDL